jgi:predicted acetyltransferase
MDQSRLRIRMEPLEVGALEDGELRLELEKFAPHVRHKVPAYHFRMLHAQSGEELGAINLRLGWDDNLLLYAGHIGYGVHAHHRGHGYAGRSVRLLVPLARRQGFEELWITCNPENTASRKSCERAGARLVEIVDVPRDIELYRQGIRQKCRYRLPVFSGPTSE